MRVFKSTIFLFLLITITSLQIHSECLSKKESYKKYVENSTVSKSREKNEKSIELLKEHLKCYPDKDVYFKLAAIYEYIGKYYLASTKYRQSGQVEQAERVLQKMAPDKNIDFRSFENAISSKLLKKSKKRKIASRTMFILGALATTAGSALFIHDIAGGTNSLSAQYSLLIGGLTMFSAGIGFSASSYSLLKESKSYSLYSNSSNHLKGEDFMEYCQLRAKKMSAKSLKKHGGALLLMSLPLFAITIYSFFHSHNYYNEMFANGNCGNDECGLDIAISTFMVHTVQLFTLGPAVLSFISGLILVVKAEKNKNLKTDLPKVSLKRVSPMIDPVTKTYGVSMGFSF